MTTLNTVVLVVHVLVGVMMVGLILIQRGKGADAGAAFGSGASGTVFGARGSANFLSRSTAILAAIFFCTSLGLAYLGSQREAPTSVLDVAADSAAAPEQGLPVVGPKETDAQVPAGTLPVLPPAPAAELPAPADKQTD
ncbi:MAG: preprotein translocase subunit SecG [Gammaproteobacteria bacterium]|nr:preprotein translocase subunit SecG [Gammaproteobacteria bacterium]MCP5138558.1 preprotein translocase subunit SecG [Chromatiales bacterium]